MARTKLFYEGKEIGFVVDVKVHDLNHDRTPLAYQVAPVEQMQAINLQLREPLQPLPSQELEPQDISSVFDIKVGEFTLMCKSVKVFDFNIFLVERNADLRERYPSGVIPMKLRKARRTLERACRADKRLGIIELVDPKPVQDQHE